MEKQYRLSGNEVRQKFLDFFASKGCMIEPGASLIPHNDPTLLWINAGVSALKKYFDGSEKPASNRSCNAQKSIRTNDIENVGRTARHHTFFEMLGNFSIGDYFKKERCQWSFELLTQVFGFDADHLAATVFAGDENAPRDEEGAQYRIASGFKKENIYYFDGGHLRLLADTEDTYCG